MKGTALIFLACLITTVAFAKGAAGLYTISCTMLNKATKQPIANTTFLIHGEPITTNAQGRFEYQMRWVVPCPSGISKEKHWVMKRKLNPKYILLLFNNSKQKIENKWQQYWNKEKPYKVTLYW